MKRPPQKAPGVYKDMTVVASMQQGVRSRGDGVYLCRQERRIQFLHENIDHYLRASLKGDESQN